MGQYKISVYFKMQIGICISINETEWCIDIPFVKIFVGRLSCAKGVNIFGKIVK